MCALAFKQVISEFEEVCIKIAERKQWDAQGLLRTSLQKLVLRNNLNFNITGREEFVYFLPYSWLYIYFCEQIFTLFSPFWKKRLTHYILSQVLATTINNAPNCDKFKNLITILQDSFNARCNDFHVIWEIRFAKTFFFKIK